MKFANYIAVVAAGVDGHNNTGEIATGSKLGIDATKRLPGEGFNSALSPLIKMDEGVKAKVGKLLGNAIKP